MWYYSEKIAFAIGLSAVVVIGLVSTAPYLQDVLTAYIQASCA